jgi:hypothetical protein
MWQKTRLLIDKEMVFTKLSESETHTKSTSHRRCSFSIFLRTKRIWKLDLLLGFPSATSRDGNTAASKHTQPIPVYNAPGEDSYWVINQSS